MVLLIYESYYHFEQVFLHKYLHNFLHKITKQSLYKHCTEIEEHMFIYPVKMAFLQ